jgi:hypothetical protein
MTTRAVLTVAVALSLLLLRGVNATSPSPLRFTKEDLPTGGTFLSHPANASRYYFVPPDAIAQRRENFGKSAGLYYSPPDAGGKYKLVNSRFNFRNVFLHPVTHKLFALIQWRDVYHDDAGLIGVADKGIIAVSDDGVRWKDLTPPDFEKNVSLQRNIVNMEGWLAQDPERPNRICFIRRDPFGFVLRSLDDAHSKWEILSLRHWQELHPTTRPATAPH